MSIIKGDAINVKRKKKGEKEGEGQLSIHKHVRII